MCKYEPGGHFAPHFDGHYVLQGDDEATVRSLKTFMMYLNGGFLGGTTNFVDESQTLYQVMLNDYFLGDDKKVTVIITMVVEVFQNSKIETSSKGYAELWQNYIWQMCLASLTIDRIDSKKFDKFSWLLI